MLLHATHSQVLFTQFLPAVFRPVSAMTFTLFAAAVLAECICCTYATPLGNFLQTDAWLLRIRIKLIRKIAMMMRSFAVLCVHLCCAVPPTCMPVTLEHTCVTVGVSQTGGLQADKLRHLTKYFATMLELEAVAGHRQAANFGSS